MKELLNKILGETWIAKLTQILTFIVGVLALLDQAGYHISIPSIGLWILAHFNVKVPSRKV